MRQISVEPLQPGEESQLVRVHNLGFKDHIEKYARFSRLRAISVDDIETWRKAELYDPGAS